MFKGNGEDMRFRVNPRAKHMLLDITNEDTTYICLECIGDPILKGVKSLPKKEVICTVCKSSTSKAIRPARIASFIRKYLPTHFSVDESIYDGYEMTLTDVVMRSIRCNHVHACEAIALELANPKAHEDDFYRLEQEYCWKRSPFDDEEHERWWVVGEWKNIAYELTHEHRFFSDNARRFFEALTHEAVNAESAERPGLPAAIKILPAGTIFYRARIAENEEEAQRFEINPLIELGAAPIDRAKINRMSAARVSLMYVSQDPDTCVSEVSQPESQIAIIGKFISTAPLKIFDFNALDERLLHTDLSLFDPDYEKRANHRTLLRYLHEEVTQPINDADTDYVVTQAFTEYIRRLAPQEFDGISYRSVQHSGGVNFVLFDKSNGGYSLTRGTRATFSLVISGDSVTRRYISAE